MALSSILRDLHLAEGCDAGPRELLPQIQNMLGEERASATRIRLLRDVGMLFESADVGWLLSERGAATSPSLDELYRGLVRALTDLAALPPCETDSGDLPASAYARVPDVAREVCDVLRVLLGRLAGAEAQAASSPASARAVVRALAAPLCVFAATHVQEQPWSSPESRSAASQLLEAAVRASGSVSVAEFLCGGTPSGEQPGALSAVLRLLRPQMTKESWKRNQATKFVFSWILTRVGRPWLADHLDHVFASSLLISDDYRTENKVLGVKCLQHIVVNVPAADLRQYNRAQVLYHALYNHLYTPEAQLVEVVLPCLLDLLSVLEKPCGSTEMTRRTNRYDQVLRLVLTHMEMEYKLALRRVYARNLAVFAHRMGVVMIRHLKRLERVIVGYLEVSDSPGEQSRLSILDVLEVVLQNTWPRVQSRLGALVRALLKLMCDVTADSGLCSPVAREELLDKATRCLLLLDRYSEGQIRVLLNDVDSSCAHHDVLQCLQRVRDSS
ncbi:TELO2-interacting protein 2 isoform X2 [Scleropages formosus]|uniref:TELO2 interacting protein 2 n=1 Tax=Scleropages formosus TaxID=113540 RepID=A0A8C9S596_SCLFO|nr:TELO2-interacting protein 2 isoform X2 [Scleropages formosus]